MLQRLSARISDCLTRAADAEHRAREVVDPAVKRDYDSIATTWRHLAESYRFAESLERFVLDVERAKRHPAPPTAPE